MRRKLKNINIMMLTVLEALYLHKTTILAAEKLGIAQPSVSSYLKQLREITGDRLFIRTPEGLLPTKFCVEYYTQAKEILDALDFLVADRDGVFDPQIEAAQFFSVIPFFKARMLLEAMSVNLMNDYPLIRSNLLYLDEAESMQNLKSGLLDIFIGFVPEKLPKYFYAEKVMDSEFIVLCSDKSRFFKNGKISRRDFIKTPHIKLSAGFETSILDDKLKKSGLLQEILISVPDIGSEIILLRETAHLLIIDKQDAEIIMQGNKFKILKTDFVLPQLPIYVVWHMSRQTDPAHKWFRDYIREQCHMYNKGKATPQRGRFPA